jgi:hypothetical protein
LTAWLGVVTGMTIADIKAIPDDKWTTCFGGCARSANALLADTVTNLNWTTEVIHSKESNAYSHMDALATEFTDKNLAIAKLSEASAALCAAISAASDETLNSTVMAPWQMPTPVFMLAHIAASHIWYHDGQFNYIHGLLGDGKMHWMGD